MTKCKVFKSLKGEFVEFVAQGVMKSRMWLRVTAMQSGSLVGKLKGRQVVAVTNLNHMESADLFDSGMAAIFTVNGHTTVEPAKVADKGYRLA